MLSYALRYVIVALFLVVAYRSYRQVKERPFWHESMGGRLLTGTGLVILSIVSLYNVDILQGYQYEGEPIALTFPLKGGIYCVTDGGSHPLINGHIVNGMTYAVDIEALNSLGRHSKGFSPPDVADYEIYGAIVYSPCEGEIVEAMKVIPDSPVNQLHLAKRNMNRVVLECGDVRVLMGHLQPGSVTVRVGDWVQVGQPLGKVGNSGKSRRPHLHIQANGKSIRYGDSSLPMLFDGDFLVRNSIVVRP